MKISDIKRQELNFRKNKNVSELGVNTSPVELKNIAFDEKG